MVLLRLCELLSNTRLFKDCQCERKAGKRRLLRRIRKKEVILFVVGFILSLFLRVSVNLNRFKLVKTMSVYC